MKKAPKQDQMYMQPAPQIIVSVRDKNGRNNAQTVGFAGNANYHPDMLMISIIPEHLTYDILRETGCFVVNLPMENFKKELYYIGSHSGRDVDKFAALDLKWENGSVVDAPLLTDCPVNIECRVVMSIKPEPGHNEIFFGKVEKVHVDEEYLDEQGHILWENMDLFSSLGSMKKYRDVAPE
ncbi:flavin reductase family protein [Lacticaseibacillus nasuensis]|uniref:flavin reductase family protein n=1 Tax=Lacticaseibacillus nasuensis TaxID=944671 RepID=UPI0022457EBB|nr:flavin reductase family protein [Lacticaseibacillus nasuensis]MCX2456330.1 flavin reductase family protein [Lacticaseibacillus nasuensis]